MTGIALRHRFVDSNGIPELETWFDYILITDDEAYNLSFMIPREADKIEELMAGDN